MRGCTFPKKRRGLALIGLVFVSFLVLSVFALVAFTISTRTLNIEIWQAKNYERIRLSYLARSAVNAAAEELIEYQKDNDGDFDYFSTNPFIDTNTGTIELNDADFSATLELTVSGDVDPFLYIIGKAENDGDQTVVITALYDTEKEKIVEWSDEE